MNLWSMRPKCLTVFGLAAPYGVPTHDVEERGYKTVLKAGVFRAAIAADQVQLIANHRGAAPLSPSPFAFASQEDRTLGLIEGEDGLFFYAQIVQREAIEVLTLAKEHLRGCSLGHTFGQWQERADGCRVTTSADLYEISLLWGKDNEPARKGTWAVIEDGLCNDCLFEYLLGDRLRRDIERCALLRPPRCERCQARDDMTITKEALRQVERGASA